MFRDTIIFLVIGIVAALLGFGVIAGTAAMIAKVLFVVFLIICGVSLLLNTKAN
jgi:uncharacterized membrane protein YtjA (UPF0391 family)